MERKKPSLKLPPRLKKLGQIKLPPEIWSPHLTNQDPTSLIRSLLRASKELEMLDKSKLWNHTQHVACITWRTNLLSLLFHELDGKDVVIPPSATASLRELLTVINKTKDVLQDTTTSCLWDIMEAGSVSRRLQEITRSMSRALEVLPLELLAVSREIADHVELVRIYARNVPERDEEESNLVRELEKAVGRLEKGAPPDVEKLRGLFFRLRLESLSKCKEEIRKLQNQIPLQAGTDAAPYAMERLRSLIGLVVYSKKLLFQREEEEEETDEDDFELVPCSPSFKDATIIPVVAGKGKDDVYWNVPEELKCPISLDLMRDPVIVESGHTYDRASISEWLESGHCSCPLSGQKLARKPPLIPNYAIRSLVSQWCDRHNVPFHINAASAAGDDTVKMTAAFLVGKLATGSAQVQTQAAYELRLLAKRREEIRTCIAEAGAIPFLVPLLYSSHSDSRAQENAVTALLNLSINDNNKALIMVASGAVDAIVGVVQHGGTMAARENAAALLFSLSVVADNKVAIGANPAAIPALVTLLREGNCRGKKDAATALYNLSVQKSNKDAVLKAGVVGMLLNVIMEKESATVIDDALALLSLLAGSADGLEEILSSEKPVIPCLIDLVSVGSDRGKENAIAVLTAMCHSGGEAMITRLAREGIIGPLQLVVSTGSSRSKRKATPLLKLLMAYPTQSSTANR